MIRKKLAPPFSVLLLLVLLSACVVPPSEVPSPVIPQEEMELLSSVRRGKNYALSGRMGSAEEEFRRILRSNPNLPSVLSDLGFVLQAQGRLSEAQVYFERAKKLSPDDKAIRDHLARVLYRQGELERAAKEYEELIYLHVRLSSSPSEEQATRAFDRWELAELFRKLSVINYVRGFPGEAECYSRMALDHGVNLYETVQHARLLLSLEKSAKAFKFLRRQIAQSSGAVPSELLFDYGLASLALSKYGLADESFSRVLVSPEVDSPTRRVTKVLREISSEKQLSGERPEAELNSEVCGDRAVSTGDYWPYVVQKDVSRYLNRVCNGGNERASS